MADEGPGWEWPSWTAGPGNGGRSTLVLAQLPREKSGCGLQFCPGLSQGQGWPCFPSERNRKQNLNQGVV